MSSEEKEIVVKPPIFMRSRVRRHEVETIIERLNFFNICRKISKYIGWPITAYSVILLLFATTSILKPGQFSPSKSLIMNAMLSIGIMNIFTGLLLMAKE